MFSLTKNPEKRFADIENRLKKAYENSNLSAAVSVFSDGFLYFLRIKRYDLLSDFVSSYLYRFQDTVSLKNRLQIKNIAQAVDCLESSGHDVSALSLCDCFGLKEAAIELLAKRGRANDLITRIGREQIPDKEILQTSIAIWGKYNGDIARSPAMSGMIKNVGKHSPESLPDIPNVKEIAGFMEEAALLYERDNDVGSAARCFEEIGMYQRAGDLYTVIKDKEGISRMAEAVGNLGKALEFAVKPERRIRLFIRLGKFDQARKYAAGMETPEEYFMQIRLEAKTRMEENIKSHNYIEAMELAAIAECDATVKNEILNSGRELYNRQLISASTEEEMKAVYSKRISLEEKAGNFEEAGVMVEEILKDHERASLLYEKANLFNRAIHAASESCGKQTDAESVELRIAELHAKGGNLLSAAQLYEKAELFEKATSLYEKIQNYQKAAVCYARTVHPELSVLARLYEKSGEYEKAIGIFMESGTFSDLEEAMAIAKSQNLAAHMKIIGDRINCQVSGSEEDVKKCFKDAKREVESTYTLTIGVDFGTTTSVGAIFNKRTKKVEIIPVPGISDRYYEPSIFGVDENNRSIYGETAHMRSLVSPDCVVARVKRAIGQGGSYTIGSEKYTGEEIAAKIIQKIKNNAEEYLKNTVLSRSRELMNNCGLKYPEEKLIGLFNEQEDFISIRNVVLTVPAYYNDNQKRATRDAAEIAGLKVLRLMHEPTAAAMAYGYKKSYSGTLAVVDLGGGTLDISILDVGEGVYEVMSISGDPKLGGSDIDGELLRYAVADISKTLGVDINRKDHASEINRLRDVCENLKISLSTLESYTIELSYFLNRPRYALTLTRKELENISRPILIRFRDKVKEAVLEYCKDGSKIDHFLLVGNATKMPAVRDIVNDIFRSGGISGIDPGSVVASGAALHGASLSGDIKGILLLDVVPYSLGISIRKKNTDKDEEKEMSRLIERNTTIPTLNTQEYTTVKDNQTSVDIMIYQGESDDPGKNYFLGNFQLNGIPSAPAGKPQIGVKFEIGTDCVLTVTAENKETGRQQSIRIEGAVTLSLEEKEKLRKHFQSSESTHNLEKKIEKVKENIDSLLADLDKMVSVAGHEKDIFSALFHEKVEVNASYYSASAEQAQQIQDMFFRKDKLPYDLQKYQDRISSEKESLRQLLQRHLDFSERDILHKIQERLNILLGTKKTLSSVAASVQKDILDVLQGWTQTLRAMEPNLSKMSPEKAANSCMVSGRYTEAIKILESLAAGPGGLTRDAFRLLLECDVHLCLREEYRETHKKYGYLFELVYPDFNRLDSYLQNVGDSVVMITATTGQGVVSGSGFAIAPNLIITNRHVVEGASASDIRIFGKDRKFPVSRVELDSVNDLAVLKVDGDLKPLRLGEFIFVAPGEQVLALGFPSPSSTTYGENIYISKGIVNSIRKNDISPERVIFVDAKIGRGMSGGPLINDLGEVIGINTLIQYEIEQSDRGTFMVDNQPIALPVHLIGKFCQPLSF